MASCLLGAPGSLHPPTVGRSSRHTACISSPLEATSVLVSVVGATKHASLQMLPREIGLGARKRATAVSTVVAAPTGDRTGGQKESHRCVHCTGSTRGLHCGARIFPVVVCRRFYSCVPRALVCAASVVVVHGLTLL